MTTFRLILPGQVGAGGRKDATRNIIWNNKEVIEGRLTDFSEHMTYQTSSGAYQAYTKPAQQTGTDIGPSDELLVADVTIQDTEVEAEVREALNNQVAVVLVHYAQLIPPSLKNFQPAQGYQRLALFPYMCSDDFLNERPYCVNTGIRVNWQQQQVVREFRGIPVSNISFAATLQRVLQGQPFSPLQEQKQEVS